MKKSIVTLVAAATLFSVAAPVVVNANNNLGTTHTNAKQRVTDYLNAVKALENQKTVVNTAQGNVDTAKTELATKQNARNLTLAVVEAYKAATTAEQQAAVKQTYGVDYTTALSNDETAFAAVETAQKALTEAEAVLATETAKLPALEAEVARTQALLTPEEKKNADQGIVPGDDKKDNAQAPNPDNSADNTKSDDKKPADKPVANDVKAATTATGSKTLPKTSAAK